VDFQKPQPTATDARFVANGRTGCTTVSCGNTIEHGDAVHISKNHPDFCPSQPCIAYVGVYGTEASVYTALVTTTDQGRAAPVTLLDGEPTRSVVAHAGAYAYFDFWIAASASAITFAVQATTGDPDLYVGFGTAYPSRVEGDFAYRSAESSGETLTVPTAHACTSCFARVAVYAWSDNVDFTISATSTATVSQPDAGATSQTVTAAVTLQDNVSTPLNVAADATARFKFSLATRETVEATLTHVSGASPSGMRARVLDIALKPERVKSGAECTSDDFKFGDAGEIATVEACAALCANRAGCKYFIFGTGSKAGACYAEMTSSRECTEGWEDDEFDFYELPEPEWATADGSGHLVISPDACAELPCNVAIEVKGAAAGSTASSCSLLVKRWAGDAATGGGGGGLVVLILMLLGCGVYGVLVWQGKRSAQSDWAAARDMVDVAKNKITAMRQRRGRQLIEPASENITAPLNAPWKPDGVVVLTQD